jgi:hypothetical protein
MKLSPAEEKAAAEKEAAEKAAADDGLIELSMDGEVIRAHPRQVALWKKQGWTETEAE